MSPRRTNTPRLAFAYERDFTCLAACALYVFNVAYLRKAIDHWFVGGYLNDLLMVPASLPWVLRLAQLLRVRRDDSAPSLYEILIALGVWSVEAEWFAPRWLHVGVSDGWDVVAYATGAACAYIIWRFVYGGPSTWSRLVDAFRRVQARRTEDPRPLFVGHPLLTAIRCYQVAVSPNLSIRCRFTPSCSEYSYQVIERHGIWRGLRLTRSRIARCKNDVPLCEDPVPEKA